MAGFAHPRCWRSCNLGRLVNMRTFIPHLGKFMNRRHCSYATLVVCMLAVVGCGPSGPKLYQIKGTVTREGRPVKYLYITFSPDDDGTKAVSVGASDKDGRFEMMIASTPGVYPGPHKIFCHDPLIDLGSKTSTEPDYLACIKEYSPANSPLTINVEKNISNYELKLDPIK